MKVFISYKSEEQNQYDDIARVLHSEGVEAWHPEAAAGGRSLSDELQRAIQTCDACIFIATPASVDSSWCLAEVGAFWGRGKRLYVFKPDSSLDDQRLPPQLRHVIWTGDRTRLVLQIIRHFRRARRRMLLRGAILAALIVAATYSAWLYGRTLGDLPIPPVRLKGDGIAEFYNRLPRNNYDQEWQIFSDSKWGGTSTVWYSMEKHADSDGFYMSIHFNLDSQLTFDRSGKGYCGVYTEFSFPPGAVVNLSAFDGIKFRARYRTTPPEDGSAVEFYLQVAIYRTPDYIPDYRYHEAKFSLKSNISQFEWKEIPFEQLQTPSWSSGDTYKFDKTKVFRIALVIKSSRPAEGYLDFDDLRLFR